jgi:hypothetical protein
MARLRPERAGIGFRVKTGYAIAIDLVGPVSAPAFACREEVLLADLDDDDSRQPYHAGLHRGERIGAAVVRKARRDAERRAATALRGLVQALGSEAPQLRCIGLVVGSDIDPLKLGNLHIRAHALEGRFYREVLESAARNRGLESVALVEREAFADAARRLQRLPEQLREGLARIGVAAGRPWRRDEQLAALAAWVALAA